MPLSWNEIKSRALAFSRTWADAANEDSQGKPFWIDFFEIFGITDKRVATFEHAVKKLKGIKARFDGFVDLFWPGMLLVEQKSRGKNLDVALTQALSYFPGLAERDLPQIIIVCDFARFRVHKLTGHKIRNPVDRNGARNMAQTAKTQPSRLMLSPKALQKALHQSAKQAQRLADAFGVVVPSVKAKKAPRSRTAG